MLMFDYTVSNFRWFVVALVSQCALEPWLMNTIR